MSQMRYNRKRERVNGKPNWANNFSRISRCQGLPPTRQKGDAGRLCFLAMLEPPYDDVILDWTCSEQGINGYA